MVCVSVVRRRSLNSHGSPPDMAETPSGVCADVRVPSTALHLFVSHFISKFVRKVIAVSKTVPSFPTKCDCIALWVNSPHLF